MIAPLSVLAHWKKTVEDWTFLNGVLYYDLNSAEGRNVCRYYEYHHTDITTKGTVLQTLDVYKFQILITSNEVFAAESEKLLSTIPFQYIVFDEAHKLKN